MKYVMFVVTDSQRDTVSDESDVDIWVNELDASGKRVIGEVLQAPTESRVVRVRDGKRYVTDGPFAETKEWICGFDILEVEDLDEAIEIASRHPMARNGQLELRPFMQWDETAPA
ncbi:YciI family protein [Cryocola sp. 340MFSha3.1]|uniref:YciI family protein n=1 Tax=Cryocola sp. 340MFSha3.1 TaxID=1169145 RepID=UPI000363B4A7|nr:YciI family protein [Cryocola sp. 340MFSha3.1]